MDLDDFLPLTIKSTFDMSKGASYNPVPDEKQIRKIFGQASLDTLDGTEWGVVHWFHKLETKRKAKVLVKLGDFPLLAVSSTGKGRIACMAGTTLGTDDPEERPFWNQSGWKGIREPLLRWLME